MDREQRMINHVGMFAKIQQVQQAGANDDKYKGKFGGIVQKYFVGPFFHRVGVSFQ